MKILALDSAGQTASVCLMENGRLLAHTFLDAGLTHSTTLLPMAEATLRFAGVSLAQVDRIAVSAGPGSFTGLRIGIGTVKGLCLAADKPCVGVSTLLAMAYTHRAWEGLLCTTMDARAGQVYGAVFAVENNIPVRLAGDFALPAEEMAERLQREPGPILLAGNGSPLLLPHMQGRVKTTLAEAAGQTAAGVALASLTIEPISAQKLAPVYLRRPQAERERDEKMKNRN